MVYRIGEGFAPALADVQAALEPVQFVECGASQEKSIGWIPPRGEAHGPLVESVSGQWIMKLMIESKAVPGNMVRRKVDERVAEIEAAGGEVFGMAADISKAADIEQFINAVAAKFGCIDILVNNAGITKDGLLFGMKSEDWDLVLKVNLSSMFYISKPIIRDMCKKKIKGSRRDTTSEIY